MYGVGGLHKHITQDKRTNHEPQEEEWRQSFASYRMRCVYNKEMKLENKGKDNRRGKSEG